MKKSILILTDLSENCWAVADVATTIACQLNNNIILLNTDDTIQAISYYPVVPMASTDLTWLAQRKEEINKLTLYIKDHASSRFHSKLRPKVTALIKDGPLFPNLRDTYKTHAVEMVFIGPSTGTETEHFLFGSDTKIISNRSTLPVCLVTPNAKSRLIKEVVFATNLLDQDIAALAYLVELCRRLVAKLTIVHIRTYGKPPVSNTKVKDKIAQLCKNKIALATYQEVYGKDVTSRLNQFCKTIDTDMLAMSHEHHSILFKAFRTGTVSKTIDHQKRPLLIVPDLRTKHEIRESVEQELASIVI